MNPILLTLTKPELNRLYKLASQGDRKATIRLDHILNLFLSLRDEALYYADREALHDGSLPQVSCDTGI